MVSLWTITPIQVTIGTKFQDILWVPLLSNVTKFEYGVKKLMVLIIEFYFISLSKSVTSYFFSYNMAKHFVLCAANITEIIFFCLNSYPEINVIYPKSKDFLPLACTSVYECI